MVQSIRYIANRSLYKFGGKLALFILFGTFYMTKAKQDMMKCLFSLYSFTLNLNHRETWSLVTRIFILQGENVSHIGSLSVAILSPDLMASFQLVC